MEIRRDTAGYNTLTDPKPASPSRGIRESADARLPVERDLNDRRRRPDRRRQQRAFKGTDRRKKTDRRQPKLLGSRRLSPQQLKDRRGRLVDVWV